MSVIAELLELVPAALEIVEALKAGHESQAEQKAKALAQAITLKRLTREAAKRAP